MEEKIVSEHTLKGVNAISTYQNSGPKYFPTNENEALKKLKELCADGALMYY